MSYRRRLPTPLANTMPRGIFGEYCCKDAEAQMKDLTEYIVDVVFNISAHKPSPAKNAVMNKLIMDLVYLPSSPFLQTLLVRCAVMLSFVSNGQASLLGPIAMRKFAEGDHKFKAILDVLASNLDRGGQQGSLRSDILKGALTGAVFGNQLELARYVIDRCRHFDELGDMLYTLALINHNRAMLELLIEFGFKMSDYMCRTSETKTEAKRLLKNEYSEYEEKIIDRDVIYWGDHRVSSYVI